MTEFFFLWGLFVVKFFTVLLFFLFTAMVLVGIAQAIKSSQKTAGKLVITDLNERYSGYGKQIKSLRLSSKELKAMAKQEQKQLKKASKSGEQKPMLFVLDFHGDLKASATEALSETISALLQNFQEGDSVMLRLESAGGLVHAYGLASAQLQRLAAAGVKLTVCVDKVAASGGYMMAAVADKIIAAPFAVLGSVGVVAQLPNFNKILKKNDIDIEYHTAGKYKRTLTVIGENSDEGRQKFLEDLEHTHKLFKQHIAGNREQVDVEAIATGEIWYGADALEKKLVDAVGTSDAFILEQLEAKRVVHVAYQPRRNIAQKMGIPAAVDALQRLFLR